MNLLKRSKKGRRPKHIDWDEFAKLCALQCTQADIAFMLKMDADTIRRKVSEHYGTEYMTVYNEFAAPGRVSLRRDQFVMAKKNSTMAIWLGKIWLDQRDKSEEDRSIPPNNTNDLYIAIAKQHQEIELLKEKLRVSESKTINIDSAGDTTI